ncbi:MULTISPECIES: cysteine desulfurase family protein [Zunongwangia]|jgi:cysteine desulfurase|uniref:Cysteine desulfurase n=3 Tax=Zunongwangia profunda TaxID=398743 RepID=D5B9A3_ZUNPS|nr:cysteine desulfurase family protein [Zunongwangia profunda]MAC66037.1 cysteine desulfurase [Flavobacteriaceae bacterium]MAS70954.1 cysteine desulfurase [Zunongwangia sp.]ADF52188.1 cysteine desulfurase [Zunongwangia profunda SM-A87]MAG87453.1 cysteine desulfurase [Flavobacteriaceae bacterium]HAJ82806.1 cysteine desulfurase [Zunongwangia profunda]|tara:strand:+ start:7275 stop:8423 length:1149 start_codon:yes stop_codon:yes gene_type:complete
MEKVYLDSAATTQMRPEVITKITEVMQENYGNPSSTHSFGRSAKSLIERARKTIAKQLNVTAAEIIFTSGGTEADNLALNSAVRDLGVRRIITSEIEHHAVLYCVNQLKDCFDIEVEYVKLTAEGEVDLEDLGNRLEHSDVKTLVSLMHVNNEVGNKLDIKKVALLCKQNNALFHSDTVQSIGHYELDLKEIPVDFTAVSAHKFHGPKGVGFAFIRKNSGLKPLIFGGEQERGYRAGTEGLHNIVGLEEAFKLAYQNLEEEKTYTMALKSHFIESLKKEIPGVKFNGKSGDLDKSTYTLINVNLPVSEEKALMLLFQLDLKGIACSKGSACQSGSDKGSHVLNAFLPEEDLKTPSIRFSFSKYNTKEEIDYVVKTLKEFIES